MVSNLLVLFSCADGLLGMIVHCAGQVKKKKSLNVSVDLQRSLSIPVS